MNVPVTRRAMFAFWSGVKSSTFDTAYLGAAPSTLTSARFLSPSWANASSRMCSIRWVSDFWLATVKSQAA